jgi:hypothetical protein
MGKSGLTTSQLYNLDSACRLIKRAFHPLGEGWSGGVYQVGSSLESGDYRDIDVRLILNDEEFASLFRDRHPVFWELLCIAIGDYLRQRTGLNIDFQIQAQTEANEKHRSALRSALGMGIRYAGGGDGTPDWFVHWPGREPAEALAGGE